MEKASKRRRSLRRCLCFEGALSLCRRARGHSNGLPTGARRAFLSSVGAEKRRGLPLQFLDPAPTIVGRRASKNAGLFFPFCSSSSSLTPTPLSSSFQHSSFQTPENSNPSSKPTSLPTPEAPVALYTTSTTTPLPPPPTQPAAAALYREWSIGGEAPGARTEAPPGREQPRGPPSSRSRRQPKRGTSPSTGPCVRSCPWPFCLCSRACRHRLRA